MKTSMNIYFMETNQSMKHLTKEEYEATLYLLMDLSSGLRRHSVEMIENFRYDAFRFFDSQDYVILVKNSIGGNI